MAAQFGSMVKRMHAGRSSQSGLYGALLAAEGFTGIKDVFESPYGGFCTTFSCSSDRFNLEALTAGLGTPLRNDGDFAQVLLVRRQQPHHARCDSIHANAAPICGRRGRPHRRARVSGHGPSTSDGRTCPMESPPRN
jgi:hypothetical protein